MRGLRLLTMAIAIASMATAAGAQSLFNDLNANDAAIQAKEKAPSGGGNGEKVKIGLDIAPVPLNLAGRNKKDVALGSYLVNAVGGCNDCHTWPNFATGGDPYQGQPEQINTAGYLAGGRPFGPFVSPNITPDKNGLPAGLTFAQFLNVLRTGVDPDDSTRLLQVMPWPAYKNMTDRDIFDIYVYLTAIPSIASTEAAAQR